MAYNFYKKLWQSEFDNFVSKKGKLLDMDNIELKLEVHDNYKKDEKITTKFEPVIDEDVKNKAYLDEKLLKIAGHISLIEREYTEFEILSDKQSVGEVLTQRAVKTTVQIPYDKGLFDSFSNADEVSKDFSFVTRRRGDIKESE